MVIISTSATEVSIHAVSPELGVQFVCTLASQAGGAAASAAGAAAAGSAAAGGVAGAWANDASMKKRLTKAASRSPQARASSPAREDFLNFMILTPVRRMRCAGSQRCGIGFAGADAHRLIDAEHEDLAVADLAGFGRRGDRLDHLVDMVGGDRDFDLQFGEEAHGIFGAAIDFGMALLAPVSLDLGHRQIG